MMLEKVLRFFVLAGVFALTLVPFIVASSFFFPYITGKNFAFRIIVEMMAAAWIVLALLNPAYRPRRSWVLTAFTVFVLIIGLADVLGAYPFKSLWSNYERMDGWVTLAHLLAYLFVAASMLSEYLWKRLFQVMLAISACISVYGVLQTVGLVAIGNGVLAGLSARIDSTFGNPIYLAAFMLFHVFIALLLLVQSRGKEWSSVERATVALFLLAVGVIFAGILKSAGATFAPYLALVLFGGAVMWLMFFRQTYLLTFILLLDAVTLLLTSTRGTILGLLGGSLVAALLIAFFERPSRSSVKESSLAWRIAVGYLVFILLGVASFFALRQVAATSNIGFLSRLATISLEENGTKARFINWETAWKGVKERPILGWGQENFALVFDKYYDPRMYAQEPWFDRVHNIIFDWLVAGGFLGLFTYLSIFAAALWALWSKAFTRVEASILTGLLAGYFFHNFFVFDNVTSYILFATVLAYIAWRSASFASEPPLWRINLNQQFAWVAVIVMIVVCWVTVSWVNMSAIAQNKMLIQALVQQSAGIGKNLEIMKSVIAFGTFGTQEAREQLMQMAASVANNGQVDMTQKRAFYELAVSEMKLQQAASPLDARFPLFLGIVHNAYGNYPAGAEALQQALAASPKKQSILYEIAANAQARGDVAAALDALKRAHELELANPRARIMYATMLIQNGKGDVADEILAPIIETGEAADPRIMEAYRVTKEYGKIARIWEGKVKAQPNDPQGYFTLAAAYYGTGQIAKSIATLEAAAKISPEVAAQAAGLIQQVKAGAVKL